MVNQIKQNSLIVNRNFKTWKTLYKYFLFKKYLLQNNIIFFYYDFIEKDVFFQIKLILKANDLIMINLKKNSTINMFLDPKYSNLKNIFNNNTLMFTSNNNLFLNKSLFNVLCNIKNIYCTGIWFNQKFYRYFEFKSYLSLNEFTTKKKPIYICKKQLNNLKNTLNWKY